MRTRIGARSWGSSTLVLAFALSAALTSHTAAQESGGVRVSGIVFDSVGRRVVSGAVVRFVLARNPAVGHTAVSDSVGQYRIDGLPEGTWLATFLHPIIDSLGLEPAVTRVDMSPGAPVALALATPSPRTLAGALCGPLPPTTSGVLTGTVRRAGSGERLDGATVIVEWPEWVIAAGGRRTEMLRREGATDAGGRYVVCGIPDDLTVRTIAMRDADRTGMIAVAVPTHGFARQDFTVPLASTVRVLERAADASGARDTVRLGRAAVQGVVRNAAGRPVAGAVVRILGSGDPSRSGEDGGFAIGQIVAGTQTLEVRALGALPVRRTLQLTDDTTLDVSIDLPSLPGFVLDTVRVAAAAGSAEVRAIERRAQSGRGGVFMSGRQVRAAATVLLTDAFRAVLGVRVVDVAAYGQRVLMRGMAGRECVPSIFLDGVPLRGLGAGRSAEMFLDDFVLKEEVAAAELYPRSTGAPAEFMDPDGCGVVVVWTRQRLGGSEPRLRGDR